MGQSRKGEIHILSDHQRIFEYMLKLAFLLPWQVIWTVLLCAPSIVSIFRSEFWSKARTSDPYAISQQIAAKDGELTVSSSWKKSDDEGDKQMA
jgi:hypothetical protein